MLNEPSLLDLNNNLQQMAEKLMNGDIDKDVLKDEIDRANALVGIADKVIQIYEVDNKKIETELHMSRVADSLGYVYVPEQIKKKDGFNLPQYKGENKKLKAITDKYKHGVSDKQIEDMTLEEELHAVKGKK